jgi:hypothetical protein
MIGHARTREIISEHARTREIISEHARTRELISGVKGGKILDIRFYPKIITNNRFICQAKNWIKSCMVHEVLTIGY